MNLSSKIILFPLWALTFLLVLFTTFHGSEIKDIESWELKTIQSWTYSLTTQSWWTLQMWKQIESESYTGNRINYISLTDRVLSNTWIVLKNNSIFVDNGIYLINFNDQNNIKVIRGEGYDIDFSWPWYIFINSINKNNVLIYSLNTQADIKLKKLSKSKGQQNQYWEEYTNTIRLYPHTYLSLNPKKNNWLKEESDRLRVSQIFNLWYINSSLYWENQEDSQLLDTLSLKNEDIQWTISKYFHLIKTTNNELSEALSETSTFSSYSLPWENYIKKYTLFLLNEEKKRIYYENLILRDIQILLHSKKEETQVINDIIENLKILESLPENETQKVKELITYFYQTILLTENKNISNIINFTQLYSQLHNRNSNISSPSLLLLKNTFYQYDFTGKENFYKDLNNYVQKYILEHETNKSSYKIDYLLFFLENNLISDLNKQSIDIRNIVGLFNNYTNLSFYYYDEANNTTKKTGIYINSEILKNIQEITRNTFFEPQREENGLLKLKESSELDKKDLNLLQKNIGNILDLYSENIWVLDVINKKFDQLIATQYEWYKKNFQEYFIAINTPKEYASKYDKTKKELLETNTINEGNDSQEKLSLESAQNYISQFEGIIAWNYKVTLRNYDYCIDPIEKNIKKTDTFECYEVENFNINGTMLSFIIFPFENNKMEHIKEYQNGVYIERRGSYKLDELKNILDEKYKTVDSIEEKNKYDFKKFFLNTFATNNQEITYEESKTNDTHSLLEEDSFVKVFKRNKLLGESGDFASIKSFFTVAYNDLKVTRANNIYSIYIDGADIRKTVKTWFRNEQFYAKMFSNYEFSPSHSFYNSQLLFFDTKSKEKKEMLNGNKISIQWYTQINDLDVITTEIIENLIMMNEIVKTLHSSLSISQISISYSPWDKTFSIKAPYQNKNLSFFIREEKITQLLYWKEAILDIWNPNSIRKTSVSYKYLHDLLNNVK